MLQTSQRSVWCRAICLRFTSRLNAALSITSAGGLLSLLQVRLEAGMISRTCNHTGRQVT